MRRFLLTSVYLKVAYRDVSENELSPDVKM